MEQNSLETKVIKETKSVVKNRKKINQKQRQRTGYKPYIYKVLKQVHPEATISRHSMSIMNTLMDDIFERLASEAGITIYTNLL